MNYIEKLINWNFLIFANNVFLFVVFPLITTMKGLKMGARMESFRYINVIFLCVFIYIWISDIFFTFSNENPIAFRINFKSLISKCPNHIRILPHVLCHNANLISNNFCTIIPEHLVDFKRYMNSYFFLNKTGHIFAILFTAYRHDSK